MYRFKYSGRKEKFFLNGGNQGELPLIEYMSDIEQA